MERSTIIIVASIVVIVGLIAGWAFISSGQQEAAPLDAISDIARIQSSVQLSHLSIATSENFARQKIYIISANLKNVSDSPLRVAEVKLTFTDFDGKPIHDYSQIVLSSRQKPIPPGTDFRFEIRQENLPRGWNYRVPVIEVTKIVFNARGPVFR